MKQPVDAYLASANAARESRIEQDLRRALLRESLTIEEIAKRFSSLLSPARL